MCSPALFNLQLLIPFILMFNLHIGHLSNVLLFVVIQPSNTDLLLGLSSPPVSMSPVNPLDDLAPLQGKPIDVLTFVLQQIIILKLDYKLTVGWKKS